MKKFKKLVASLLAVLMVLSLTPVTALADGLELRPIHATEQVEEEPAEQPAEEVLPEEENAAPVAEQATTDEETEFVRIFHLDCGRKYFSVSEIEGIIDQLAANYFTHIQLAFGNDGFRFLLDDMSVTTNGTTYSSEKVKNAIVSGNSSYSSGKDTSSTMLSESDMDSIIAYAQGKGIEVIPMLNTPGHMDALVSAMKTLEIRSDTGSEMSLTSEKEIGFIKALQKKYIDYFAGKGSQRYNLAADEYSFSKLSDAEYTAFAQYVNDIAAMVIAAGMTPMAYNDGINYSGKTTSVAFNNSIQICYWAQGTNYASVQSLSAAGFKIINNNDAWYYVLGDYLYSAWSSGQWGYGDALRGIQNTPVTQAKNAANNEVPVVGSVLCCWCDGPSVNYTDKAKKGTTAATQQTNQESVYKLIQAMAAANPDYFKAKEEVPTEPELVIEKTKDGVTATKQENGSYLVKVKEGSTLTLKLANSTDDKIEWQTTDDTVATVKDGRVAFTGKAGTVIITAIPSVANDGDTEIKTYTITFEVQEAGVIEVTKEKTITIPVGGTATDVIDNEEDFSGVYKTEDTSIATVESAVYDAGSTTKTMKEITDSNYKFESGKKYLIAAYRNALLLTNTAATYSENNYSALELSGKASEDSTAVWTIASSNGGYTVTDSNGKYLNIGALSATVSSSTSTISITYDATSGYWDIASGSYHLNQLGAGSSTVAGGWTSEASDDPGSRWKIYEITEKTDPSTTVTFKGVSVGTTYVTIGDTRYTVNVVAEDLSKAEDLPIQLWITNVSIEVTGVTTKGSGQFNDYNNGGYAYYISVKANEAYGENGVELSKLAPAAVKDKAATEINDRTATYSLWKGTVLDTTTGLQKYWWTDMTKADGRVDYQYVRYYGGEWAVSNDRTTWTAVTGEGSTGSASDCKEQIIAYYMQRTDVTEEVITDVVDWGNTTEKWASEKPTQYAVLDFAVQYPSTRIPDEFPVTGKTVYFHCDENDKTGVVLQDEDSNYYRRIGLIKAIDTTDYEVYMVTVTPTSDDVTDQLTDSSTALTTDIALKYEGTEKVVWVDDEANLPVQFQSADAKYKSISGEFEYSVGGNANVPGLEIYQRQGMLVTYYLRAKVSDSELTVHYIDRTAGNHEFYNYTINVKGNIIFNENIGLADPWKGNLVNGDVVNTIGVTEHVSADLSTMPKIGAQYRYASNYECKEVTRSEDGKEVFLYYEFVSTVKFVVDFGLPLKIMPKDVSEALLTAKLNSVQVEKKSQYANITTDQSDKSITYTLNQTIDSNDNFQAVYKGSIDVEGATQTGEVSYTITVIPASTVYYEDSFVDFYDADSDTKKTSFSKTSATDEMGVWYLEGDETTAEQVLEVLGKKTNVYGYDSAYNSSTMLSMGSAKKVTVNKNGQYAQAKFTFKGTGFDVISLTDSNSGAITVEVFKDGVTAKTKDGKDAFYLVNNYYGYKYENGQWVVTPENGNALYQIPVMKVNNLDYGTYTVVITADYASFFDKTGDSQYSFWLDAIRVYDPMGEDNETYKQDEEGYPQYIKLRDELAKADSCAVFIDGKAEANVAEYKNFGPNNEVYLAKGQAISFKLTGDLANITSIQIGAKAPSGTAKMSVNGGEGKTIETATEMYYEISKGENDSITITNTGDGILSLTNLKITYSKKGTVSLTAMNEAEQTNAIMMVRTLFAPPAPVVFEPETFTVKLNYHDVYVREYVKVTVTTSDDVDYITVGDKKITRYTEERTWGGFHKGLVKTGKRVWSYYVSFDTAGQQVISVVAYDTDGLASEAIDNTVNVKSRSSRRGRTSEWHI